jgi:hypothetical protein
VQRVLDTITESAAFVRNGRLDILSANRLGYALYSEVFANPDRPANLARFIFLDRQSRKVLRGLGGHRGVTSQNTIVTVLRTSAAAAEASKCAAQAEQEFASSAFSELQFGQAATAGV